MLLRLNGRYALCSETTAEIDNVNLVAIAGCLRRPTIGPTLDGERSGVDHHDDSEYAQGQISYSLESVSGNRFIVKERLDRISDIVWCRSEFAGSGGGLTGYT